MNIVMFLSVICLWANEIEDFKIYERRKRRGKMRKYQTKQKYKNHSTAR